MTLPKYIAASATVRAKCAGCEGAFSVFQWQGGTPPVTVSWPHRVEGELYNSTHYMLFRCPGCGRGALGIVVSKNGNFQDAQSGNTLLEGFYPFSTAAAVLPKDVPEDITAEFREAELCAAATAYRAASALLRSTLEKTLKANGYRDGNLKAKIEAAASDGVITAPRKERAHAEIRVLGNDVLHDDYRAVTAEEVEMAHHYTQRILEDFYDDRPTTLTILVNKKRVPGLPGPPAAQTAIAQ